MQIDRSNGYEAIAHTIAEARSNSIGATKVREWARILAPGATILDIGCGSGVPISQVLIEDGFNVFGVDASETLVQEFRQRFPSQMVECSTVEDSSFFDRKFDAMVSWGLMFLLTADAQRELIGKVARALNPGGHFLFTSPRDVCTWLDGMTGHESRSLGQEAYEACLQENGLELVGNAVDEGENYYYFACMT